MIKINNIPFQPTENVDLINIMSTRPKKWNTNPYKKDSGKKHGQEISL